VSVACAYSPSEARRKKFAENFDFPLTDRLETILTDKSVDAVLVLTPPNTHLELVERCHYDGIHVPWRRLRANSFLKLYGARNSEPRPRRPLPTRPSSGAPPYG